MLKIMGQTWGRMIRIGIILYEQESPIYVLLLGCTYYYDSRLFHFT